MASAAPFFPSPDPRVYCLLGSIDADPGLAAGLPPAGLLSSAEQARLETLTVLKRRRDWLLGRWTAKRLVQSYLALAENEVVPLAHIEIFADEDGAPYARVGERLPVSLSISHSGFDSFCAVCPREAGSVGADVEQLEPRAMYFVRQFFTPAENGLVEGAAAAERDALITALWSAKEAVLKTLRLGLRADTRQVEVTLSGLGDEWRVFGVSLDPALNPLGSSVMKGWHLRRPTHVLSLALLTID